MCVCEQLHDVLVGNLISHIHDRYALCTFLQLSQS
jgi:hypothetical protein